jgi:Cu+-exporting ATPase
VIIEGVGQVDNSLITGESVPVSVQPGAEVSAGAVNIGATLVLRTTAVSANSRIAQIADLVREATAHKTKITGLTDRISEIFVPAVIVLSIVTYLVWAFVIGDSQRGLSAAIAVLVIACPCALGIAVPMSLVVATSLGARHGIVIRDPDTLSLLNRVRKVVLDKTGTLTTGNLRVAKVTALAGTDEKTALAMAAAVERSSAHPLAKAIAAVDSSLTATDVIETAGSGVQGMVNGTTLTVTRSSAVQVENQAELASAIEAAGAMSLVVVSWGGVARLLIALDDDIRDDSKSAIEALQKIDVEPILLSGDAEGRVAAVASELEIATHFSGVTPEQKLTTIESLKSNADGSKSVVAMVGDGLNDVAALAGADIGIAMGSGTHAAQSAAAITIVDDNPMAVAYSLNLARRTWVNIKQNLGWAFGYNVILIPVAALGLLNPMLAGTAMAFSSISVVLNALKLKIVAR